MERGEENRGRPGSSVVFDVGGGNEGLPFPLNPSSSPVQSSRFLPRPTIPGEERNRLVENVQPRPFGRLGATVVGVRRFGPRSSPTDRPGLPLSTVPCFSSARTPTGLKDLVMSGSTVEVGTPGTEDRLTTDRPITLRPSPVIVSDVALGPRAPPTTINVVEGRGPFTPYGKGP